MCLTDTVTQSKFVLLIQTAIFHGLSILEDSWEVIMNAALNRRTSDRTYPPEPKKILINEKRFILNDISREGIGVLVEDSFGFSIGQRITSILLESHADAQPLIGIVNHMSQNDAGIICGIRFEFRNNAEFDYVEKLNQSLAVT